jgi:hypothetical protein
MRRRFRRVALAVSAVVVVAIAGGVTYAVADIGSGGVINGCYTSQNGQLRLIDPASELSPERDGDLVGPDRDAGAQRRQRRPRPAGSSRTAGACRTAGAIPGRDSSARKDDPRHIRHRIQGNSGRRREPGRHVGDLLRLHVGRRTHTAPPGPRRSVDGGLSRNQSESAGCGWSSLRLLERPVERRHSLCCQRRAGLALWDRERDRRKRVGGRGR